MASHKLSQAAQKNADASLVAGIQKYVPNAAVYVSGVSTPAAQVATKIQSRIDAANAVLTAEAAWHGSVKTSQTTEASTDAYVIGARQTVLAMFASQPTVLAEFSVSPRKAPAPRTAAQKVVSAAKAKATRAARHTMSAKQKAAISGSLTGPVVVPLDGSASTVSPAPQSATPPAAPAITNGSSTLHS